MYNDGIIINNVTSALINLFYCKYACHKKFWNFFRTYLIYD